jgi:hypothetical protein
MALFPPAGATKASELLWEKQARKRQERSRTSYFKIVIWLALEYAESHPWMMMAVDI